MSDAPELKPCPFCGGEAEIINISEGENEGGSCVCCTKCMASGNVEFGFKENFISNWNRRDPAVLAELPEVKALVAAAVEGAAGMAEGWVRRAMHLSPDGYEVERTQGHMAQKAAKAIRASIPADAKAALDAYVAGKMREAAAKLDDRHRVYMTAKGRNPDDYTSEYLRAATELRALIREDKP